MKILVSYFSAGGVTKRVATRLADILDADLEEIRPVHKYTDEDLDWRNNHSRSSAEMNDENCRPEIERPVHDLSSYDVVLVGYPIWWYAEPMAVRTFFEEYDFSGKTVVPFCTSLGAGVGRSVENIRELCPDSTVLRNVGVPFGHTIIAIQSSLKGLRKLLLNEPAIYRDLDNCWSVVAEAIQTILRREAYPHPYEALKALTRTNQAITEDSIREFIDGLDVSEALKQELHAITPHNYTGM